MKKIISFLCVIVMIFNCMIIAQGAEGGENAIELTIGEKKIVKIENGVKTAVETDVAPIIKDGRTFVPVRFISENFGYEVVWNGETQTVMITKENKTVSEEIDTMKSEIEEDIVKAFMRCTRTTPIKLNNKYIAVKNLSGDEYYYRDGFFGQMKKLGFEKSETVDKYNEGLRYTTVYTFKKEDIKLTYLIEKCLGGEDGYTDAYIYVEFFVEIEK